MTKRKAAGGERERSPVGRVGTLAPSRSSGQQSKRRDLNPAIAKQRPAGELPEQLSDEQRATYIAAVGAELGGGTDAPNAEQALNSAVGLFVEVWLRQRTDRAVPLDRNRVARVKRLGALLREHGEDPRTPAVERGLAESLLNEMSEREAQRGDDTPKVDPFHKHPFLRYTASAPRTGRGQSGWKLVFAWGCAMDGYSPTIAAIAEDVAVRTHEPLRATYRQYLLSDPGHRGLVMRRWRASFRSLFMGLPEADQGRLRDASLPGASEWMPAQPSRDPSTE